MTESRSSKVDHAQTKCHLSSPSSSPPPPKRWASLADRLNPNRPAFDPQLKASWKTLSKSERRRIISEDRKSIRALKSRGTATPLPFEADPDDHCETGPAAYAHVVPLLEFVAGRLGKEPRELAIYDPYYCAGGTVRHLNTLGFRNVYNKSEDFYEVISQGRVPPHDIVLTNPPYSGDHFDRLLKFLAGNGRPALLLLPEHFSKGKSPLYSADDFFFLSPPERYHYWTPEGMRPEKKNRKRHKNLVLGSRNSPFASHWFICMEPVASNDSFLLLLDRGEIKLVEGCRVHKTQETIQPTNFKGAVQNDDGENGGRTKSRRRRNKKKTNSSEQGNPLL